MLAHYMRDPEYVKEILEGDIHTANMKAAGLTDRNQAKTMIYALCYGAGDAKLGTIVGGGYKDGKEIRGRFLKSLPAFERLLNKIERHSSEGTLLGLDGRRLRVRSSHAALNTLLQGAGAIVMKKALVILTHKLEAATIPYKLVANVHDEFQLEAPSDFGDAVGTAGVEAIQEAGQYFELRCPLSGEYKISKNWSGTH